MKYAADFGSSKFAYGAKQAKASMTESRLAQLGQPSGRTVLLLDHMEAIGGTSARYSRRGL